MNKPHLEPHNLHDARRYIQLKYDEIQAIINTVDIIHFSEVVHERGIQILSNLGQSLSSSHNIGDDFVT